MGKIKQRNWLIILTVFLVVVSSVGLFLSIQQKLSFNSCAYGENVYKSGENIPEYNGGMECTCNSNGAIRCDSGTEEVAYSGYSTQNLKFSYKYGNLLSDTVTMQEDITSDSASYINGVLKVSFERNVLCSEDGIAPTQTGLYQLSSKDLRLTILTNMDNSKYTTPCKIVDTFEISKLNMILEKDFQIFYQSEDGEFVSLGACIEDDTLYGDQEVFKSKTSNSVCICNTGVISCRDL
ncbi:MAG: hypothetical protein UR96_C0005G0027 [candidate division WS6 bacterium GW2011_GWC1_36_11]|uniref:Uncharacterized protein n=2 Tax=Candidatus Dojkabacteria TaxID=74243 RepID=A0A0G0DH90_9BACT|nr:MAG: hypothetical protein UR96_C0005G0027 [candidate division WS6 bacterium GW2011_GWC1_36_11]KKQ15212.1 MAG: hypothetical protein US29_C0049G0009 [candidate division WS6 bacterium GW2011_GWF1_36_8]HAM37138.1 hypothetical protein [Patescibacteria group bacterium]HAM96400.1 hypothetical protein [Patescibacteria group bacterium]